MSAPAGTLVNSHSAADLHARLQAGTRAARRRTTRAAAAPTTTRKPRVHEADVWRLMHDLRQGASHGEPTIPRDRALRRILSLLVSDSPHEEPPVPLALQTAPVLIIRSGPWPLLHALLTRMAALGTVPPVTVLCHRQDAAALEQLAAATALTLHPLFYPRFEPFNPITLRRLIADARGPWAATFMLDASRAGTGHDLEHVRMGLASVRGAKYVWNASGQLRRLRSLRETLGRENYETVRRLLRWRAGQTADH